MAKGQDTGGHPGRKVHREVFDNSIVDVDGTPTKRAYVSRYDEEGNYLSQGYSHHGPATRNETLSGTWRGDELGGAEAFERDMANEQYAREQRRGRSGLYPDER
jgi:hypothetical protein